MALVEVRFSYHVRLIQIYNRSTDQIPCMTDGESVLHQSSVQSLLESYILMALQGLLHPCKPCNGQDRTSV